MKPGDTVKIYFPDCEYYFPRGIWVKSFILSTLFSKDIKIGYERMGENYFAIKWEGCWDGMDGIHGAFFPKGRLKTCRMLLTEKQHNI